MVRDSRTRAEAHLGRSEDKTQRTGNFHWERGVGNVQLGDLWDQAVEQMESSASRPAPGGAGEGACGHWHAAGRQDYLPLQPEEGRGAPQS